MFIETIWELNSLKKKTFPKSFWDTERVISGLLSKLFWRGFQNCILSVQMTTLRKNKFLEETFFISFSDIQRKYFSFVKNFSAGLSKLHSTCPAEHFEEKLVRKKYNYYFRTLSRKIFGLLAKVSRQGGENWRSTGTLRPFLKKVIFSSFWDIELEKFRQGCQYCILRIRDNWKKVFCWIKLIL